MGTGKSLLLLQSLALGFVNDWVVINIPEGEVLSFLNSTFIYHFNLLIYCQFAWLLYLLTVQYSAGAHIRSNSLSPASKHQSSTICPERLCCQPPWSDCQSKSSCPLQP